MEKHELVDQNGKNTEKILTHRQARDLNNIPEGYYIAVVGVVILNSRNEILLQKRSSQKRNNPNKWGICGGKINIGETPIQAGIRETLEEIGVTIKAEDLKFLSTNILDKLHFTVYYVQQDVKLEECQLQQEEVEQVQYFKIEKIEDLDNEGFEWLEALKQKQIKGE